MRSSHATLAALIGAFSLALFSMDAVAAEGGAQPTSKPTYGVFPVEQIQQAKRDILGEAALRQPGGPSYEFFVGAMPPLRYVDTDFRDYPITLSAPSSVVKARFVSNGSAVNALARQANWTGETGTPFEFFVDDSHERFGTDPARLTGPRYADGYLPIMQVSYDSDGVRYAQEAFASTGDQFKDNAVVFVRFDARRVEAGKEARVEAKIENSFYKVYRFIDGRLMTPDGKLIALGDGHWKNYPGRGGLVADLKPGESAYLTIWTNAVDPSTVKFAADAGAYDANRRATAQTWNALLARGTGIDVSEPVVNNAVRAAIIGDYMLLHGNDIRYSQGNQYAKLYIGEGGDATRSIALMGHTDDARRMIPPLFHYTRKNLEFHQAAFKLQMLAHYFRLTRDVEFLKQMRPLWEKEIDVILNGRETNTGMLPREKYCGDIATMVYSLNSNANCWRALRDMSIVLKDLGPPDDQSPGPLQPEKLAATASDYRKIILDAIEKSTQRSVTPPFVPVALSGEEHPYDPIWGSVMGSYYNLMIQYILGSGVFTPESQTATDIMQYLQQKGGLCMGMLRARESLGWWVNGGRINDLYGMRYALTLLHRDEPDRALVSFYGKLAQGFTRDTFIGCEGSSIGSPDGWGREMYLPPNSAANANFLEQLRYILVQDEDLNDDGRADTLRLAFAAPRRWLANGGHVKVTKAPTEFGEISFVITSAIDEGHVDAEIDLPKTAPGKTLLRLRLPDGATIASASAGGKQLSVADGQTIDLTGLAGHVSIAAKVSK
jgi:hypothetical protein